MNPVHTLLVSGLTNFISFGEKSTKTLSARMLLNVILHKSKVNLLWDDQFKNEHSFLGEGQKLLWGIFSIEYSDLKRARKLYQQECFWMWFFTQEKFQSLEKYYRFKKEYSFLGEGKNFPWEDSETNIFLKQIFFLQGRARILLISLLKTWDSAWMDIILRGEQYFYLEEYLINRFLAKEFCSCGTKLVFFWQEADIHEILLRRIINLGRKPTILSINGYHLGRRVFFFIRRIHHQLVLGKIILFLWEKLVFLQESDIHEILLKRIINLWRRPSILSLNGYHLGRTAMFLSRRILP